MAADPSVLPAAEGRELFEILNENLGLLAPTMVIAQIVIVIALGAVLGLVGMLVGRTAPRWLPIAWFGLQCRYRAHT